MATYDMDGAKAQQSNPWSSRSLKLACFAVLVIVVSCTITIVVLSLLLKVEMDRNRSMLDETDMDNQAAEEDDNTQDVCESSILDVAIIGAGPSGTFAAWQLSQKYDWNIGVFDTNNRIGGRLYSITIPGINYYKADMGAMRFPSSDDSLRRVIDQLGLTVADFTKPSENDALYYLRGKLLDKDDIASGNVPYDMTDHERNISAYADALYAYWNNQIIHNDSKNIDDPFQKRCVDGKMAYEKGLYNALAEVASSEAIEYLLVRDGFPGTGWGNRNYAKSNTITSFQPSTGDNYQLHTIQEGFQELVEEMMRRVVQNSKSSYQLNQKVTDVTFREDGVAVLKMQDTRSSKVKNVCAKRVIAGVPAEALRRINFDNDIEHALSSLTGSVYNRVAGKTYLAYNRSWWRNEGQGPKFDKLKASNTDLKYIVTDKPIGMVLDIGEDNETGNALLLSYFTWWKSTNFWQPFQENGTPHSSNLPADVMVTDSFINQIQLQLSEIFNISVADLPTPYAAVTHSWNKEPFYAGWHTANPGYNYPEVMKEIRKPVPYKDLYIIGEAFSNSHGWTEGALETTENVLKEYFDFVEF